MGWFSSDIDTFDELFVHTLQDIYYAEHQIVKALPDMVAKASDAELKRASAPTSSRPRARSSGSTGFSN